MKPLRFAGIALLMGSALVALPPAQAQPDRGFRGRDVLGAGGDGVQPNVGQERGRWQITIVDGQDGDHVGMYTSLAVPTVGSQAGRPAISYFDWTNRDLKYAYLGADRQWHPDFVDRDGDVGRGTSLAFSAYTGLPMIAYHDFAPNRDLKIAWKDNPQQRPWFTDTVYSAGNVGWSPSLRLLSSGYPAVACGGGAGVMYLWEDEHGWDWRVVDNEQYAGTYVSLAIRPNDQPAIAYSGYAGHLKYAWSDGNPNLWFIEEVDTTGSYPCRGASLAILPSGYPAIAYYNRGVLAFAWRGANGWHKVVVDGDVAVGEYPSLAILPSGEPAIS